MKNRLRKPTHPGVIIRDDYLEPLSLSVTALAERLGVSRKHLSNVINEKVGVTPDMALRLSRAFNTTPDLWLNLQRNHDLWVAEHSDTGWDKVTKVPGLGDAQAEH
ncbi:MAG: addiction module antidote protein, HigA family [Desulfovibrio sp.]|nr:MAG: addiction module antidote protein, HigA family [Desulfovibrio sp.]